jgi:hypothetical protein
MKKKMFTEIKFDDTFDIQNIFMKNFLHKKERNKKIKNTEKKNSIKN